MDINNLKEFEALIRACRKLGVHTMTVGGISFQLLQQAPATPYKQRKAAKAFAAAGAKTPSDPFEAAMAEAKARATKAKDGLTASLQAQQPAETPNRPTNDAPDDLAMLLWSAGGSGDV